MIIPQSDRVTEGELVQAIILFLPTCPYGEADYRTIFFNLSRWIKLSAADREVSRERPTELKWHTIVRNISAHDLRVAGGQLVKRRGGGFQLASRARKTEAAQKSQLVTPQT